MDAKCFNHPEELAVAKCTDCGKPICRECLVYREGSVYCSEECAIRRKTLGDSLHSKLERSRQGPGVLIRMIQMLIASALILGLLHWLGVINLKEYLGDFF